MLGLGRMTRWLALRKGQFIIAPVVTGAMRCFVFEIREDDVSGAEILALLAFHLERVHELSPPDSVFALDFSGLRAPGVTLWSAWCGTAIAGMGALRSAITTTSRASVWPATRKRRHGVKITAACQMVVRPCGL